MGLLEDKARARLFYRYLSTIYDRINPFVWNERMRAEALGLLDVEAGDRVLDVGCGTGFATEGLLQLTDDVHALDQSVHQMERAFEKFGRRDRVRFYRGDAERLPFAADAFDVVWSSGSIEYWPRPVETLAEFRRVARPGGQVLVVGPNAPKTTVMQRLADAIMLFYGEDEADRMFREAGFEEFRHVTMGPRYDPDIAITTVADVPAEDARDAEPARV
ncbi:MAG: methyltransferase domain-containing protein [Haloferacaceae archaeon]